MKRVTAYIFILLLIVASAKMAHSATMNENIRYTVARIMEKLKDYFHQVFGYPTPTTTPSAPITPGTPIIFEEPSPIDISLLSPFQQLFRTTITLKNQATNILATTADYIKKQAQAGQLTIQQASDQFITTLMATNRDFIAQALKETLDIDLNLLTRSFATLQEYVTRLQKAIEPLNRVQLKNQIIVFTNYLSSIQKTALELQQAGIVKVSAALAAQALTGYQQTLFTKFNEVYNAYPQFIEKVNDFKIAGPGKIIQSTFNRSSELIEQIVTLHQSTGTIGTLLIQNNIIAPLDRLKNDLRKLGNTIDFTTRIKPIIVVAPPTTYDALLAILKTFAFNEGFQIKDLVMQDITTLTNLMNSINNKVNIVVPLVNQLQKQTAALTTEIQKDFVNLVKANPLRTIGRAPMVLLEIMEVYIAIIKKELDIVLTNSATIINNLSDMLATTAHFLPYLNQTMGATPEKPFVNPDIIRGLTFIADDSAQISTTIQDINEGIGKYSLR